MSVLSLRVPAPAPVPPLRPSYGLHGKPALFSGRQVEAALAAGGADAALVHGWIAGLLTGINMALPHTHDVAPFPGRPFVQDLVLAECMRDPEQPLHEAALHVIETLIPARARSYSETLTLAEGPQRVMIRRDTLRYVQEALIRRGFMGQPRLDGCDSPALREALQAFQANAGLQPTGLPDPGTVLALLRP